LAGKTLNEQKKTNLKEIQRLIGELESKEETLMTKHKRIQEMKAAKQKSMDTEWEVLVAAAGNNPALAVQMKRQHEKELEGIKHVGTSTGKIPEPLIKGYIEEINNKYAGVARTIYNSELGKLNKLPESQREALIKTNPMAAEIWRIHRGDPAKQLEALKDPGFIQMMLPPEYRAAKNKEMAGLVALIRPFEITGAPGAVPTQPGQPAPTAVTPPFDKSKFTTSWKEFLIKNPDKLTDESMASIMKSLNTPEERQAMVEVVKEVQGSPKAKVKPKETAIKPAITQEAPKETAIPWYRKNEEPKQTRKIPTPQEDVANLKKVLNSKLLSSRVWQLRKAKVPEAEIAKVIAKEFPGAVIPPIQ